MEVNPAHAPNPLVKADIIEALETRPRNRAYPVVRDEEVLLPAHEDVLSLRQVGDVQVPPPRSLAEGPERLELRPVLQVHFVRRAPVVVLGEEGVLRPDDLALEVGRQGWVVFCQAWPRVGLASIIYIVRNVDCGVAPCMRRYPHSEDSLISTCLISTCTS
jgi:hypothetical protein